MRPTQETLEKLQSSFKEALSKNLESDDSILFVTGEVDVKCFNGNMIELSKSEKEELVKRILK